MGNCCCRRESSACVWADDDAGSERLEAEKRQRLLLLGHDQEKGSSSRVTSSSSATSTSMSNSNSISVVRKEVIKIKMTKKELEEMMGRVHDHVEGMMTLEQILADRLINGSDHLYYDHRVILEGQDDHPHPRSWIPALQSIPEVN